MTQEAVAISTSNQPLNGSTSLTPEEYTEIMEYERIVQFRDSVLAGTHPRVKIPAHLGKPIGLPESSSLKNNLPSANQSTSSHLSNTIPSSHNELSVQNSSPNAQRHLNSRPSTFNKSEINPIFLEKSDGLIKAEIQLQRQRLERALREQVEHQRITAKALLQTSESLPDFDVSEALSKALSIVPPCSSLENEPPVTVARSSGSNSFEDNTFYSSQNDTPSPSNSSQDQKINGVKPSDTGLQNGRRSTETLQGVDKGLASTISHGRTNNQVELNIRLDSPLQSHTQNLKQREIPIPQACAPRQRIAEVEQSKISKQNSQSKSTGIENNHYLSSSTNTLRSQENKFKLGFPTESVPTQARSHNLSPIAPQPERVSPLATTNNPLVLCDITEEIQPAQVTALRHRPAISSTDSSPKGNNNEKKREKRRKRKAKDGSASDSPYIKPEPKSPSPYAPLSRPQKRRRGHYATELNYDRPQSNSDIPLQEGIADPSTWRPQSYEQVSHYDAPDYEPHYRQSKGNVASRRIASGPSARRPHSPQFSAPYIPSGIRPRALSTVVGGRLHEENRYIREPIIRASVRPDADRERSRSPPHESISSGPLRQIVIDEHGRQYYNVTPAPPIGQSVGPTIRYRDEELMYERVPARVIPSRIPMEAYENESVLIRRRSPVYTASRRVVTQPEFFAASTNYRPFRQRGYSVYPTAVSPLGEDHDQYRVAPEYRQMSHFEEPPPPREYLRATTARPEPIRYEPPPRDYMGRMQVIRPEPSPRAADVRRDMVPQQIQREYSARPIDSAPQREAHPVERYYDTTSRVVPHSEHILAHESNSYYNEASIRRPVDDAGHLRAGEASRYEDRYCRRPVDDGSMDHSQGREIYCRRPVNDSLLDQSHVREPSVMIYRDEPRRDMYR